MRMKWLPAGIGLFLIGMSVVSFADERVYEQAEFPHEICGTWTLSLIHISEPTRP